MGILKLLIFNLFALLINFGPIQSVDVSSKLSFERKLSLRKLEDELSGKHLKIATVQNGVLSYAIDENGTWIGRGMAFEIIRLLQTRLNFTYTVVLPKENILGSQNSGIFGLLNNNEVDLAAAFLPMTSTYWQYAEFATSLNFGEWVVVLKRPKARSGGVAAPFASQVWLLTIISLLILGPTLYLVIWLNPEVRNVSLANCLWCFYGSLVKQGARIGLPSDSSRLILTAWWLFVVILISFYTANLVAFITVSKIALPIREPGDIKAKHYNWISTVGSVIEEASNNRFDGLYRVLGNTKRQFLQEVNPSMLETWVNKKNYLFFAEKPNVDIVLYQSYLEKALLKLPESERCSYVATKWHIFKCSRTFAYAKNFRFGPLFDNLLRTLVESGFVRHAQSMRLPRKVCPINLKSKDRQLLNSDLLQAYYILALGFTAAIVAFLAELSLKYLHGRKGESDNFGTQLKIQNKKDLPFFSVKVEKKYKSFKRVINGREYWVINFSETKCTTIAPVRGESALLFRYED